MGDKLWKAVERKVAQLLGGERVPVSGRERGFSNDIEHPLLSVEVKERQTLPEWLHEAMGQAEASIRGDKYPVVILHQKGLKHDDDFVVMKLSDFRTRVLKLEE